MQIQNAIITGSFSYNGADLSNVTSSNAYSASLSSRTTDLESTSSVLVGASASFSSILSSVSSSQQQLSASFLTLTASFNAVSASQQQISSSYIALSASYNTFSGSASTRITVDSASLLQVSSSQQQISSSLLNVISVFATTGSNSFRANQSITGSLVVSSTITAQTLVVQTVTSSIVYSSGSNIFGCDLNSRQTFTGSVLITGSLTIAGASSATSYNGATIFGSTIACSPIGCFATSCATAFIGGTITGTTIYGSTAVCSAVGLFSDKVGLGATSSYAKFNISTGDDNQMALGTTSVGQTVGIYLADGPTTSSVGYKWEFGKTTANNFFIYSYCIAANALTIASTGAATFTCQVNAESFYTNDTRYISNQIMSGYNTNSEDSDIWINYTGYLGGTTRFRDFRIGDGKQGQIAFFDGSTGAVAFSNIVKMGTSTSSSALSIYSNQTALTIRGSTGYDRGFLAFSWDVTPDVGTIIGCSLGFNTNATVGTNGGTRALTITCAGNVGIGITSPSEKFVVQGPAGNWTGNFIGSSTTGQSLGLLVTAGTNSSDHAFFVQNAASTTTLFRIAGNGIACFAFTVCAPCFATISDYRMKSNVRPIEGLSIIMNTKPYKFEYNYDCSTSFGMIAHELQDILPEAVFGEKDGEVMQGVDYMKLLPITIKAIQEQQCTICSQATMINTLKTCLGIA